MRRSLGAHLSHNRYRNIDLAGVLVTMNPGAGAAARCQGHAQPLKLASLTKPSLVSDNHSMAHSVMSHTFSRNFRLLFRLRSKTLGFKTPGRGKHHVKVKCLRAAA